MPANNRVETRTLGKLITIIPPSSVLVRNYKVPVFLWSEGADRDRLDKRGVCGPPRAPEAKGYLVLFGEF